MAERRPLVRVDGRTRELADGDTLAGVGGGGVGTAVAPQSVGDANSAGTAGPEYANPNHVHAHGAQTNPAHHAVATTSANGFMSAADKSKLDGVAANAAAVGNTAGAALAASGTAGTANTAARSDHTHPYPTAAQVGADPAGTAASALAAHTSAGDPHPQYTTAAEAAAAAPVQSVAGKSGAVTLVKGDVGLGNVANPVAANTHTVAAQTLNQTLTTVASMTIPGNALVAGDAFEIDVLFASLVNTIGASTLEVGVFLNGAQITLISAAMGPTAVAAPGRGGRALAKLVFRSVGAAGAAICNGTMHVNNLANFASNVSATSSINTTADITLEVRARTSVATTTGTVQFAAIDHAT